jgi:TonB family protein
MKEGGGMKARGMALLVAWVAGGCAAGSVAGIRPEATPPTPSLSQAELVARLALPDAAERSAAAWALARYGNVETGVVEALKVALEDPVEPVREAATWALWNVKNPDLKPKALSDGKLKLLGQTKPHYPEEALLKRVQGTVLLQILIDAAGKVVYVEVRRPVPLLNEEAVRCVREWTFQPDTRQGRPVPGVAQVPMSFRIDISLRTDRSR